MCEYNDRSLEGRGNRFISQGSDTECFDVLLMKSDISPVTDVLRFLDLRIFLPRTLALV